MTSYLISYDITDDRLRTRVAKILERHGCKRLQKSVFFAPRFEPRELERLRADLRRLLTGARRETDSVLCVPVTKNYLEEVVWEGDPTFFEKMMEEVLSRLF